jgi:hypothetical protein
LAAIVIALVFFALLVVQIGLAALTWGPMVRHIGRTYAQFTPEQRRRAFIATAVGSAVSVAVVAGLASGQRGFVVGTAVFFVVYGILLTPLAIWLDRRTRSGSRVR